MSSFLLPLLVGIVIGVAFGWLWHAYRQQQRVNSPAPGLGVRSQEALPAAVSTEDIDRSLRPLQEAVGQLGGHLQAMQIDRAGAYSALASQIQAMTRTSTRLSDRTDQLVTALRAPQIRGRWGEMQLERVVELGGMVRHCDFDTQVSTYLGDKLVRPDMIVNLSGGRQIIVDSKVPLSAFLDALDTRDPEEEAGYRRRHAHLLRTHVTQLSEKNYVDAFSPTPEFVVCFVPADPFLDAALSVDPELLEFAFERNVVVATPTTLFALLRTVALGWQQQDVSEKADEILRLGRQLYRRLNTAADHYNRIGRNLEKTVDAYNSTISSMDSRIMVTARRLAEMEVPARTDQQPPRITPVTSHPRHAAWDSGGTAEEGTEQR